MGDKKIKIEGMTPNQSMVAAALFIGFFATWFFWNALEFPTLIELLRHKDAAAWVQAIGALIMVGLTVALFYLGEYRRNEERLEEKKLEMDEAKFYFLLNGASFTTIYTYPLPNQFTFYDPNKIGERGTILHYPAVFLFMQVYPQLEKLHAEFQEFMIMQVPLGVPRLCVSHIEGHRRVVSQIYNVVTANKFYIDKIEEYKDIRGLSIDGYDQIIFEEMEVVLKYYIPHLQRLTSELKEVHESLLAFMRS